jgi:hypothetical protein
MTCGAHLAPPLSEEGHHFSFSPPFGGKEINVLRTMTVAALAATCVLVLGQEAVSAEDQGFEGKLPEPALRFAKDASLRVTEMEREWLKLSEVFTRRQPDFAITGAVHSDASLRDQAQRLLLSGKNLVAQEKRMVEDLERFRDALKKAASHYREVAVLYKAHAAGARAEEVKDDYRELARVYEAKAQSATQRAQKLAIPVSVKPAREVIEEGNLFIERLVEALSIGSVGDTDRGLFAGRIKKHGERCRALTEELSQAIEKILEGSDAQEIRQTFGSSKKLRNAVPRAQESLTTSPRDGDTVAKKELSQLVGASWSCPVTVRGVRCLQVLRFTAEGICSQSVYLPALDGTAGKLLANGSAKFQMDSAGVLNFFQAGRLVERGKVTFHSEGWWVYEILENVAAPELSGKRLTFIRESGR